MAAGAAGLACIAVLAVAPCAAASGWSSPGTIANAVDTGYQYQPAIVSGPRGQLAASWAQGEGIGIAVARRGATFGAPELVPQSKGGYDPALGIDAAGNTTLAWTADFDCTLDDLEGEICGGIHAAARLADGAYTRTRKLTGKHTDAFSPRVSVAPAGRAAVFWQGLETDGAGSRTARRPGRLGATELRNRVVLAWTFAGDSPQAQVVVQAAHSVVSFRREPGGRLTRRRVLFDGEVPPEEFYVFDVGVDRRGLRSAAWYRGADLAVALRMRDGRMAVQTLAHEATRTSLDDPRQFTADIDSGPSGLTVGAWARLADDEAFEYPYVHEAAVRARVSRPGLPFGPRQLLAPRYRERPVYRVVSAAGPSSAVVAWLGTRPNGAQGVYAAHAGPHGNFGRTKLLSADSTAPISNPAVVIDRHDHATVAWIDGLRVRFARFR